MGAVCCSGYSIDGGIDCGTGTVGCIVDDLEVEAVGTANSVGIGTTASTDFIVALGATRIDGTDWTRAVAKAALNVDTEAEAALNVDTEAEAATLFVEGIATGSAFKLEDVLFTAFSSETGATDATGKDGASHPEISARSIQINR